VKPQLAFVHKPDNNDITPWKPLLTSKPHASIPLDQSLRLESGESGHPQYVYTSFHNLTLIRSWKFLGAVRTKTNPTCRYQHPYETEILNLQYPAAIYQKANPIPFLPVDTTTATFVDTYEGVLEMLKDLKMAREIAVDLEHHDARSYVGLVSLMQISIREKDWIVDTLKPWRQDLRVLNEVFTDPKILKVGHPPWIKNIANPVGVPWRLYGHCLVTERSGSLYHRIVRYTSCLQSPRLPRRKPGVSFKEIH
jgi:exosome complex exonuclease RRP6